MPKVPQAQQGQVQEARISIPRSSIGVSREATGGGAASSSFGAVQKIFQEEKRKADEVAALDATSKLAEAESLLMNDPESGALNQRGKNAFALGESVNQSFDKSVSDIEKNLTSPEQIDSFRKAVASTKSNMNNRLRAHVSRERVNYDNTVTDTFLKNETNAAAENFNNPERVQQAVELQKAAIADHGKRNGLPPDAVKLQQIETVSKTHSTVITKMLADDQTDSAKKYFKANKKEFTGNDYATIEKDIETAALRGDSQKASDQIMASSGTLSQGLDEARKIEDPKLRDETVRRVKQRFEEQATAQRIDDENNYRSVSDLAKQVRSVDQIPPNQWNRLSLDQQTRLANHLKNLRRGMTPPKNSETYYDQMTLASANPRAFMQKNLLEDQDKIDESQLSQLIKMQTSMRQGKGLKDQELKGFETKNQVLEGLLAEMDVNPKSKSKDDREKTVRFRQALDDRVLQFEQENKRKPNNKEIRQLGEELQLQVVTDRGVFWDTKKRVFELDPKDAPSIEYGDIPDTEVAKIKEAIKRRGIDPTDEQVMQLYKAKVDRSIQRANQ